MMAVPLDDFCSYAFVPLLVLGLWCLFEGGNNVCLLDANAIACNLDRSSAGGARAGIFLTG